MRPRSFENFIPSNYLAGRYSQVLGITGITFEAARVPELVSSTSTLALTLLIGTLALRWDRRRRPAG